MALVTAKPNDLFSFCSLPVERAGTTLTGSWVRILPQSHSISTIRPKASAAASICATVARAR